MTDTHQSIAVVTQQRVHPVVAQAMASNPDPSTLRELLAVQREWEAGEARREYAVALVALKRDLPAVLAKDKRVAYATTAYQHVTGAALVGAVTPVLCEYGFAISHEPATEGKNVTVTTRLIHEGGHVAECVLTAPADDKGGKNPVQAVGSTITYLSRYATMAMLGLASADAPDADSAPALVDGKLTAKALAAVAKAGRTREAAEAEVGKPAEEWTVEDIKGTVKAWLGMTTEG